MYTYYWKYSFGFWGISWHVCGCGKLGLHLMKMRASETRRGEASQGESNRVVSLSLSMWTRVSTGSWRLHRLRLCLIPLVQSESRSASIKYLKFISKLLVVNEAHFASSLSYQRYWGPVRVQCSNCRAITVSQNLPPALHQLSASYQSYLSSALWFMCVQKANTHTHGTHSSIGSYISIGKHEEVYVVPRSPGGAVQQCNYLVVRWQSRNRFIISFAIEFQFIALLHTPYRVHGVYIFGIALCECVPWVDFSLNFYGIINENIMQCSLEIN